MQGEHFVAPWPSSSQDCRVPRDIFPLPLSPDPHVTHNNLARSTLRRVQRAVNRESDFQFCLRGLNACYAGTKFSYKNDVQQVMVDKHVRPLSAAQFQCCKHVSSCIDSLGQPPQDLVLEPAGALRELCGTVTGYDVSPVSGRPVSYRPNDLSIPTSSNEPVSIGDLWDFGRSSKSGSRVIDCFSKTKILPKAVAADRLARSGVEKCYSDPLLRVPHVYGKFLQSLYQANCIEYQLEDCCIEFVECFFVAKKNGKLRLVIDARRANCHFADPSYTYLCTGDGLSRIELEPGESVCVSASDLKDAFYHILLPAEWRRYFGLRSCRARDVNITSLGGKPVQPNQVLYPRLKVCPMGWSWAVFWCQMSVQRVISSVPECPETSQLVDCRPCPSTKTKHALYIDNFFCVGQDRSCVAKVADSANGALKGAGLVVHEEQISEDSVLVLGWEINNPAEFRPSRRRVWRIRLAIRELLRRGRATGRMLERLVGQLCFVALGKREIYSVLGCVFAFIAKNYDRCVRLWPVVCRELMLFDALSPLLVTNLAAPWSDQVHSVDASFWGLGVCATTVPSEVVRKIGRQAERWRFQSHHHVKARNVLEGCQSVPGAYLDPDGGQWFSSTLTGHSDSNSPPAPSNHITNHESDEFHDLLCDVDASYSLHSHSQHAFESVTHDVIDRPWKVVGRHRWRQRQSLPVLEHRSGLYAIKHILRNSKNHGMRHLILGDSMTTTLCEDKGRSSNYEMRRVCMQVAALSLGSGSSFAWRWIPSEWNVADGPSRGSWAPAPAGRAKRHIEAESVEWRQGTEGRPMHSACHQRARQEESLPHPIAARWSPEEPAFVRPSAARWSARCHGSPEGEEEKVSSSPPRRGGRGRAANGCHEAEPVAAQNGGGAERPTLLEGLENFLASRPAGCTEEAAIEEAGHADDGLLRQGLPAGRRPRAGQRCVGSGGLFAPQCSEAARQGVSGGCQSPQGVEQGTASQGSSAAPLGRRVLAGGAGPRSGRGSNSSAATAGVRLFPSACRRVQGERSGPHPANGHDQVLDPDPAPRGTRNPKQNRGARRGIAVADSAVLLCRRAGLQDPGCQDARPEEAHLHNLAQRGQRFPEASGAQARPDADGETAALVPVQAWRPVRSLGGRPHEAGRHHENGAMEVGPKPSKVRKRRPSRPGAGSFSSTPSSDFGRAKTEAHASQAVKIPKQTKKQNHNRAPGRCVRKRVHPALSIPRSLLVRVFIEVFCGCGKLAESVSRLGHTCLLWDLRLGSEYDLSKKSAQQLILGWLTAGLVIGIHLGTPCSSFSRARDSGPGPPQLRDDSHPLGLPSLWRIGDIMQVKLGNCLMRFSAAVLRACVAHRIPASLENPRLSRIWLCPPIASILRNSKFQFHIVDFCMFGTAWKKPTGILSVGLNLDWADSFRCLGAPRGQCKRTLEHHLVLRGCNRQGVFLTKLAEKYPSSFCRHLARSYDNFWIQQVSDSFEHFVGRVLD